MHDNTAPRIRLLVVEDDAGAEGMGAALGAVEGGGLDLALARSVAEALPMLEHGDQHAALVNLAVAGDEGLAELARLRTAAPDVPVIVMTEPEDGELALEAIRSGAQDSFVRGEASPRSIVRMIRNAVERHRMMAELIRSREREHYLATHDGLTGLVNRFEFQQLMRSSLARAVRNRDPLAILFIGLDEFVVTLSSVTRDHDPAKVAQTLLEKLAEPYRVADRECWVTASVGIAVFPRDGKKPELLIRNAERAMYAAKAGGANRHHYYAEYMNKIAVERLEAEKRLRAAIDRQEFVLHFQPQIDVMAGGIAGAEALLRWQDPDRGLVAPAEIIPIAEETGLIIPIGEWVLRTACEHAVRWSHRKGRALQLGVNVSSRQLALKGFAEYVGRVLDETRLPPAQLDLEITESCILETGGLTMATIKFLRKLGVRISIDDFGTGYSSLVALKHLPVDELKIDRAFVSSVTSDEADATITTALVTMARGCGLKAIAEGVETREQMQFLYAQGCHHMQGYLFSKPVASEEFAAQLDAEVPAWNAPLDEVPA
jgi:EAL domain-containing protein (putative c-di-GMP-specific phosphodiesterase class I)/GGDEF domain-containing protein